MEQFLTPEFQQARSEGRWAPGSNTYEEDVALAKAELAGIPADVVEAWPEEPPHPPFPTDAFATVLGYLRWYTDNDDETDLWWARIPLETFLWDMGGPKPKFAVSPYGSIVRRED